MTLREVLAGRMPVFVAGLYAVLATVLPAGLGPGAPASASWFARLSLIALPLGLLAPTPWLALLLGVGGVIGCAIGTFAAVLWAGQSIEATPLGVVAFFALSLAWGALSSPAAQQGALQGTHADWLAPRRRIPRWQVVSASLSILAVPLVLLLPLGLETDGEATFAYVAALGVILLLLPRTADLFARLWLRRL